MVKKEGEDQFVKVEDNTSKPNLLANVDKPSERIVAILKIAIPTVLTGLIQRT